jgi:folate-binding protein YgfZ
MNRDRKTSIFFQGYNQGAAWREVSRGNLRTGPEKSSPMIETVSGATTPLTPLGALLKSTAKAPENSAHPVDAHPLSVYRGVLTPLTLDAPEVETAALAIGTAVHDMGWLRRIAVRGEDRFRWLSGMVTNTVNDLGANAGAWNLVLNAQGRIQGDLMVWREADESPQRPGPVAGGSGELELEIAADQYERLLGHLGHFIIMDDVELAPLGEETGTALTAVGLTGPDADAVLGRAGLPVLANPLTSTRVEWNGLDVRIRRGYGVLGLHYVLWVQTAGLSKLWKYLRTAGAVAVGSQSLEAFRIAEGIPVYGVDMAERDLPQEAVQNGTGQMQALHFNKGCYLGQEIVERIRSRGNVHRHLRQLELFGAVPAAGTELRLDDGAVAGEIRSVAALPLPEGTKVFALAMVRGEAEVKAQSFQYGTGAESGTAKIVEQRI